MKKFGYIVIIIVMMVVCSKYFIKFNDSFSNEKKYVFNVASPTDSPKFDADDEYILSVLACEMPASYNEEALKAQAIASRTFALYRTKIENAKKLTKSDQCYYSLDEMKSKWNDSYEKYYSKLKDIVLSTKDEVMLKDRELFKSFYFSTSNGYTEPSEAVFSNTSILSVDSSWDKSSKDYLKTIEISNEELENKIGSFKEIKILKRNDTNHVELVSIDGQNISGVKFRHKIGLRSTDFDIEKKDNSYIFTTRGYGHGVGMSQYGANYLANDGKNYKDILKYYYGDIDIQKINV